MVTGNRTRRLGFFNVPLKFSWTVIFLLAIVGFNVYLGLSEYSTTLRVIGGIVAAVGLVASIIFHEYAHVLTARRYGIGTSHISVWALGGTSYIEEEARRPGEEFWIGFSGPLSSFVLGGILFFLGYGAGVADIEFVAVIIFYLAIVNIALGIFNLVPAYPLDGGRVLRSIIWKITNDKTRATIIAAWIAIALAVAGFIFAVLVGDFILAAIAVFVAMAAYGEQAYARENSKLGARLRKQVEENKKNRKQDNS